MKQKSVTLVEIIVSMVILSLILVGIAGLFVAGKTQLKRAQYKQEALNFAREKLEELEALDFDHNDLQTESTTPSRTETDTLPNGWPITWTITDMDEDFNPAITSEPQYKQITVTVEWEEP
jgi:type II secretory pathway pseudopilin PulG